MGHAPLVRFVADWELRRMFNERGYWEEVRAGRMRTRMLRNGHPAAPLAGEPYCTRSQIIAYLDRDGFETARVHPYLRPDGTIGLSGRPDPKELFDDNVWYIVETDW